MSDYNILEVIDRTLPTLRRGSRQVAQCILTNPSFVVDASLAELAREADVSEPTVLRFCSTIKCNGFRDLKIRIAKSSWNICHPFRAIQYRQSRNNRKKNIRFYHHQFGLDSYEARFTLYRRGRLNTSKCQKN
jgi:DNA-binding MurR/RpiR family transcriptional regulator